jgi:hypothetical protein
MIFLIASGGKKEPHNSTVRIVPSSPFSAELDPTTCRPPLRTPQFPLSYQDAIQTDYPLSKLLPLNSSNGRKTSTFGQIHHVAFPILSA